MIHGDIQWRELSRQIIERKTGEGNRVAMDREKEEGGLR